MEYDLIFHLSDIHVPKAHKRHLEYKSVFHRVYSKMDEIRRGKSCLIVICGDILHNKDSLSSEQIMLTRQFLEQLSRRGTTILIAGNHDMNISNKSRLDSLTPIVNGLNVNYLSKSGVYEFGNFLVIVNSMVHSHYDEECDEVVYEDSVFIRNNDISEEVKDGKTTICLYHGMLEYEIYSDHPNVLTKKDFEGHDYVMLGDIHTHTFLEPNIAYSGSLIQQHHGESLTGHGFIVWDMSTKKGTHVDIFNEYGYVDVKVNESINVDLCGRNKIYVRFLVDEVNANTEKKIQKLREKWILDGVTILGDTVVESESYNQIEAVQEKLMVNNVEYQNRMITEFLGANDSKMLSELHTLNRELYDTTHSENVFEYHIQDWSLLKLKFKNVFCYAENADDKDGLHMIDFSKVKGTCGIVGNNYVGKSSIIDIILYALFDKCSRGKKADILHHGKKNFEVEIEFMIGNSRYIVRRRGQKRNDGMRVNTEFFEVHGQDMRGNSRVESNANVKQLLCNYEDFIYLCVLLQNDYEGFLSMTSLERIRYFQKILKMDDYDKQCDIATTRKKEVEKMIQIQKKNLENILCKMSSIDEEDNSYDTDIETHLKNLEEMYRSSEYEMKQLKDYSTHKSVKQIQEEMSQLQKKLEVASMSLQDIDIVVEDSETMNAKYMDFMTRKNEQLDFILRKKKKCGENIRKIEQKEPICSESEYIDCLKKLSEYESKKKNLTDIIDNHEMESRMYEKIVEEHECLENTLKRWEIVKGKYDEKCVYCRETHQIDEYENITRERERVLIQIRDFKFTISDVSDYQNQMDDITVSEERCHHIVNSYQKYERSLDDILWNEKLKSVMEKIDSEYARVLKQNCVEYENWKRNEVLVRQIDTIKSDLDRLSKMLRYMEVSHETFYYKESYDKLKDKYMKHIRIQSEIEVYKSESERIKNELVGLNEKLIVLSKYVDIFGKTKNGIPYKLMRRAIPSLEKMMNLICNVLDIKFSYQIKFEEGKTIDIYLNDIHIDMCSGFEKMLTCLILRLTIKKIHYIKTDFLFIDEAFSTMDTSNVENIHKLHDILRRNYERIFVITHQSELKDSFDSIIEIRRNKILS